MGRTTGKKSKRKKYLLQKGVNVHFFFFLERKKGFWEKRSRVGLIIKYNEYMLPNNYDL